MALTSVTREQFKIKSEVEVVHIPTGAVFQAYPYSKPDDILQSVRVTWSRAGVPGTGDYAEQVRRMATQLLIERTRQIVKDRRLGNVA
jgi:hypothetical protein